MTSLFKTSVLALGTVAALGMSTALTAPAAKAQDAAFSDAQKDAMGEIIREYILENPGLVLEALEKHRAEQQMAERKAAEERVKANIALLTSSGSPSIGPDDASVTIVEFFDYNCGWCKRALPDIQAIVEKDKDVRVVFKEHPVLGPTSQTAALWALAAHKQDKYFEYHTALMNHKGAKEESQLAKLAEEVGLDVEKMKKDIASEEVKSDLGKMAEAAEKIGVGGTPAFIVGTTFIPGYAGEDGLTQAIAEERAKQDKDG